MQSILVVMEWKRSPNSSKMGYEKGRVFSESYHLLKLLITSSWLQWRGHGDWHEDHTFGIQALSVSSLGSSS